MKCKALIAGALLCLLFSAATGQSRFTVEGDSLVISVQAPDAGWAVQPIEEQLVAPPLPAGFPALMLAPEPDMLDVTIFSRLDRDGSASVPLEPDTLLVAVSLLESSRLPDVTAAEMAQFWADTAIEPSGEIDDLEELVIDGRDGVLFDAVVQGLPMRVVLFEMGRAPGAAVDQFGFIVALAAPDEIDNHTETLLAIAGSVRVYDERVMVPGTETVTASAPCADTSIRGSQRIELEDGRERLTAVLPDGWLFTEASFSPVFPAIMTAPDESMIDTEILRASTPPSLAPGAVLMVVTLSDPRNSSGGTSDTASAAELAQVLAQDFGQAFGSASVEDDLEINGLPAASVTVAADTFSLHYLLVEVGTDRIGQFSQFGVVLTLAAPGEAAEHAETARAIAQTFCVFDDDVPRF